LRKEFRDRCGTPELVLDLKGALKAGEPVFAGAGVGARSGRALVSRAPPAAPVALTRGACGDRVELVARFSGWESAPRLGLVLNPGPRGTGYAFLLVPPPAAPPPPQRSGMPRRAARPAPATLGAALKAGGLRLEILRDGVRLRSQVVRVEPGPLRLRASRKG